MNNDYGTAGVDDYRAKDAAAKRSAISGATGGGLLVGAANAAREETLCEQVVREIEVALEILRDTSNMQTCLYSRLFGEQPADPKAKSDFSGNGAAGVVKERLLWLRGMCLEVRENQAKLTQVA